MRYFLTHKSGIVAVLGLVVALAGLLSASSGALAATGTVRVGSVTSSVGLERSVNLEAINIGAPGLGAWTINVSYDPTILSVVGCEPGQGGLCNVAHAENAFRVVGMNIFGLEGDTTLATMAFACLQPGSTDLAATIEVFSDATLGGPLPIDATIENGTVTCWEEGVTPPGGPVEYTGDANCDGNVNSVDAAVVLQYEAGLLDGLPCQDDADLNQDGAVNSLDAAVILQQNAGLIT